MTGGIEVTPATLEQLGGTCIAQEQAIDGIISAVTSGIQNSGWRSPAASKFEGDWNGHYMTQLTNLKNSLQELGANAKTMAANYQSADESYKGAG